jgi:hypothetical protein
MTVDQRCAPSHVPSTVAAARAATWRSPSGRHHPRSAVPYAAEVPDDRPGRDHRALAGLEMLDQSYGAAAPDAAAEVSPWERYGSAPSPAPTRQAPPPVVSRGRKAGPIQALGPVFCLALPSALALLGFVLLRGNDSVVRGIGGFLAFVFAAPGLLVMGVPLRSGASVYGAAAAISAVLWFMLGVVAARRAVRRPRPTWSAFWGEFLLLALSCWAGVVLALLASNLVLGRSVI